MNKNIRIRLFISTVVLITVILSITAYLNMNTFEDNYKSIVDSSLKIKANEFTGKIQYGIRYGKDIKSYYGIEDILSNWDSSYEEITSSRIIGLENETLYGSSNLNNENLSDLSKLISKESEYLTYDFEGFHYVYIPILDSKSEVVAIFEIAVSNDFIIQDIIGFRYKLYGTMGVLSLISVILIGLFCYKGKFIDGNNKIDNKQVIIVTLLIMGSIQVVYGITGYRLFKEAYTSITDINGQVVASFVKRDIENVIDKGVKYSDINDIEGYFNGITDSMPQIRDLLLQVGGHDANKNLDELGEVPDEFLIHVPLKEDSMGEIADITVVIDEGFIKSSLFEIILEGVTIFATSFFLMVEMVLFLMLYISKNEDLHDEKKYFSSKDYNGSNLRIYAFLIYTACYMPVSFIPKVMKQLYVPIANIDINFILGLPVSVVFFGGALFTIVGGNWIDKYGWKKIIILGQGIVATSMIFCALIPNMFIFILARGFYGVGYALIYISMRAFAASMNNEVSKKKGFSSITSGIYAGVNTGAVFGAILMDKIGYQAVFITASAIVVIGLGIITGFFPKSSGHMESAIVDKQEKSSILKFLMNGDVIKFFIMITAPMAMTVIFLDYFYPVYGTQFNISSSSIGRAYLLNGICVAYISPVIIKSLGDRFSSKAVSIFSLMLVVASMLIFSVEGTIVSMMIAACVLGIGEGIGLAAQTDYYLSLEHVKKIGRGQALGIYSNIRRVAQMFGPQIFAVAIGYGYKEGIGYLGISIGILLVIYVILGSKVFGHKKMANN